MKNKFINIKWYVKSSMMQVDIINYSFLTISIRCFWFLLYNRLFLHDIDLYVYKKFKNFDYLIFLFVLFVKKKIMKMKKKVFSFLNKIGVAKSVSDGIINILGLKKVVNGEMVEICMSTTLKGRFFLLINKFKKKYNWHKLILKF